MKFSVIIPAFNAADTISATLDSLLNQTYGKWQAVIVDDGSTDATAAIAHQYCEEDSRISLVRQSNAGLSAARNTGIAAAKYEYLLFLDADDWIDPVYLEKFNREFEEDPALDALVCGWQFMLEDGSAADVRFPPAAEDMFPFFSRTCPFVVHSCVINRRVIESAGVFDSTVGFVEDWDFWQRVSRTGARFRLIREVLAFYRMRKGSLSRKVSKSYNDARKMIHQGYSEDMRVSYPVERYRYGMPDEKMNEHLCWLYCWYAGLCIGVGESISEISAPDLSGFRPEPKELAIFIFEGVYRGGCFLPGQWLDFYSEHKNEIEEFFDLLADKTLDTSAIQDSKVELQSMIAMRQSGDSKQNLGEVLYLPVDVDLPVDGVDTRASKVILSARMNSSELGKIEVTPENGHLSAQVLKQKISEHFAWPIMTDYLKQRYNGLSDEELDGSKGWELFLQELWGLTWTEAEIYDPSYNDNSLYDTKQWCNPLRVDVENNLCHIPNEQQQLTVDYYIGGLLVGSFSLHEEGPVISAQLLRAGISAHGKFELCKAAVIQGLIGKDRRHVILRDELKKAGGSKI